MLVRDDVDESRGSRPDREEANEPPSVVLRLRGMPDASESTRRRVGTAFSLVGLKPKSEVVASFSDEKRLADEVDEESGTDMSGVAEL